MINTLAELITAIQQVVEEVFNEPELKVNPPNCLEDDLAELESLVEEKEIEHGK
jgi:hypothetical protein